MRLIPSTIVNYESPEYWYKTIFRDKHKTPTNVIDKLIANSHQLAKSIPWVMSSSHKFRPIRSKPDLQMIIDRLYPLEKTPLWTYLHKVATIIGRDEVASMVIYQHYSDSLSCLIFNNALSILTRSLEEVQTIICDVLFCAIMTGLLPKELEIKLPRDPCDLRFKDEKEITVLVELIRECSSVLRQAQRDEKRNELERSAPPIIQAQRGRPRKVLTAEELKLFKVVDHWERWKQNGKSMEEFCQAHPELLAEQNLDLEKLRKAIRDVRRWRKSMKSKCR
ncbi:MAG: hypothetical protein R3B84_14135 [Zavarzinella sp.]